MEPSFLSKYLYARYTDELYEPPPEHKGIVVTVSRDTGCDGMPIVEEVTRQLNRALSKADKRQPWRFFSKEIFEKSAKKLNLKPEIFDKLVHEKDRGIVQDIIQSFAKESYPSNIKLKRTLRGVIEAIEQEGGVIILGRAGVAIVKHNKKNLHVKLTAPLEWRIKKIAKEYGVSEDKARKHVHESDKLRDNLKRYYMGKKVQYADFDVVLNVSSLTKKEICAALVTMVQAKNK